jgi:hypothetical protein
MDRRSAEIKRAKKKKGFNNTWVEVGADQPGEGGGAGGAHGGRREENAGEEEREGPGHPRPRR